ncbi:AKR_collapsed_G0047350.mRNA.1.CDS.1 [Saccharomyces cerevisiae]|nr:AKR_collapsed_G0047350.mRNA.1.CDS.1 [Saccharomyces cerevisiae]
MCMINVQGNLLSKLTSPMIADETLAINVSGKKVVAIDESSSGSNNSSCIRTRRITYSKY